MEAILYRKANPVGKIINFRDQVCKVAEHLADVDCLPGGTGLSKMRLEPTDIPYPIFKKEQNKLNAHLNLGELA